ncbi:MAG TPA: TetR/AcrR family transcriptional regulator [Burkholderiales bacterium]|jgi:AcrR family transcriptional regulator|nr:TetR/AcrR family transcriptional regulator [Burkholderiales bacterium]
MDRVNTDKPRGRPRSFDRGRALERAMHVFWRQGYEATSVSDLTRAMGINPPSLYAAFGDKEQLYLEALGRYQQRRVESMAKWFDEEPTAKAAVRRLLTEAATELARAGAPRGSMLVLSAMQCSSDALQAKLAERRASVRAILKARIDRGLHEGELARGIDTDALVDFYSAVFQGMSLQARAGASRKRLLATAALAMRAWPGG